MRNFLLNVLVISFYVNMTFGFTCDPNANICEETLVIEERVYEYKTSERNRQLYALQKRLFDQANSNASSDTPFYGTDVILENYHHPKNLLLFNQSLPGPPIIVYQGQRVRIRVINYLLTETTSVHWHGHHQRHSQYMDGVPYVTQCPILPGQSFTYDFIARERGTHYYHSHFNFQLSRGLFGAFIVRDRKKPEKREEVILTLQDWNHDISAKQVFLEMQQEMIIRDFGTHYRNKPADFYNRFIIQSILINGRSRIYHNNYPVDGDHQAPLTLIPVEQNREYRLRIIGSQARHMLLVSVDQHVLKIVAVDGFEIRPVLVDSLFVHAGERFDVIIKTDQPVDNYWLRAESIEENVIQGAAIIRYKGAPIAEPNSTKDLCGPHSKCVVFNCPNRYFQDPRIVECVHVTQLRSLSHSFIPEVNEGVHFTEFFLNFAYAKKASINGIRFKRVHISAMAQPQELDNLCNMDHCDEADVHKCKCFHSLSIKHNHVVQFVLTNIRDRAPQFHPVHMHGYSFRVLKIGFGNFDPVTRKLISPNEDIVCDDNLTNSTCNRPRWRNQSWNHGNVPGLNFNGPVLKDTIVLPKGGYVVIRIIADNPGVWSMHCHIEQHYSQGMFLVLNNSFNLHPKPPRGLPICRSFVDESDEVDIGVSKKFVSISMETFTWTVVSLAGCLLLASVYIVIMKFTNIHRKYSDMEKTPLKIYSQ